MKRFTRWFGRRLCLVLICILPIMAVNITPIDASPRALQASAIEEFEWIRQGQIGIVRVSGTDILTGTAIFQGRQFELFPDPRSVNNRPANAHDWIGIIAADMTTSIAIHSIQVYISYRNGDFEMLEMPLRVAHGEFGRDDLSLPARLVNLLEEEVSTQEYKTLADLTSAFRSERDWQTSGFRMPTDGPIVSYFGTWRFFNGLKRSFRHTGIDYPKNEGDLIVAVANGYVSYVGTLEIRGNYVLIDHGWGIVTGYAHASEIDVEVGDKVAQGDVLGKVGSTGRSTGPHLHFEMAINGIWVNPVTVIPLLSGLKTE